MAAEAARAETQGREAEAGEDLVELDRDAVLHGAAGPRVGVQDEGDRGVFEELFEAALGAL